MLVCVRVCVSGKSAGFMSARPDVRTAPPVAAPPAAPVATGTRLRAVLGVGEATGAAPPPGTKEQRAQALLMGRDGVKAFYEGMEVDLPDRAPEGGEAEWNAKVKEKDTWRDIYHWMTCKSGTKWSAMYCGKKKA